MSKKEVKGMRTINIPVKIATPKVHNIPLTPKLLAILRPPEPDWGLVRRACDAVYQGTEAEFIKAETPG